jgi:hypothetical protein
VKLEATEGQAERLVEIPQIVFYQNGVGSGQLLALGAVGAGTCLVTSSYWILRKGLRAFDHEARKQFCKLQ